MFVHILLYCFLCWVFGGCLYSCCLNASGLCQVILPSHVHLAWVASTDCKKRFWSLLCCSYKTSMFSEVTLPNIMCIVSFALVFTLVKGANWYVLVIHSVLTFSLEEMLHNCAYLQGISWKQLWQTFHFRKLDTSSSPVMESEIWCELICSVFPKFWFLCWFLLRVEKQAIFKSSQALLRRRRHRVIF